MSIARVPKRAVLTLLVMALAIAGLPAGHHAEGQSRAATAADGPAAEAYEVTLITGDVVTYETRADGTATASVEPAERDGRPAEFESWEDGDDLYVVPLDVASLVGDVLDPELFNVAGLVADGYHDEAVDETPVIVTGEPDAPGPPRTPPGLDADRRLDSIDGVAGGVGHERASVFGRALAEAASSDRGRGRGPDRDPGRDSGPGEPQASGADPLAGIGRISLDRRVEAHLDNTVDIVGAPAAWDAGYDGEGMRIAVLDTGIDDTHPDLDGKVVAASNFSSSEDETDVHGHGTHVASIAAGTGAASDGDRTGVAPGADLINAKVLNDSGSGQESDIIAGMEWAVDEGADVLNLSLGAGATDGTDPMSRAVDRITDEDGVLFVISAGNSGPRDETIGTPGAADAALTVGGTFDSGNLASFSSRGPRKGDYAPKPDITAPGSNIGAARADGSDMGFPLDEHYTNASGTSMSAPHVAGAAAILAQRSPDMDPASLKSALMGAAAPNDSYTVYEQGAGQLDVATAMDAEVLASPAPLHLGYYPYPHDDYEAETYEVTYTNLSDDEVALDLSLDLADEDGDAPPEGMVATSADEVTIDAGDTATVEVTVDVQAGDYGLYGGYLVAEEDGETAVSTPVGFFKEPERYDLVVNGLDRDGGPAGGNSSLSVINVDDRDEFFENPVSYVDGVASVRVPPGRYAVYGLTYTYDEGGEDYRDIAAVAAPEVEVTDDTEITLDAQEAEEITVEAPDHDVAPRLLNTLMLYREPASGPGFAKGATVSLDERTFSAVPSDEAETGYFELHSRWQLADPDEPIDTPVLYDVVLPEAGRIPDDLHHVLETDELATSQQEFHTHIADQPAREFRHAWRPWQSSSIGIAQAIPAPGERTDYLSPADTSWTRTVLFAPESYSSLAGRMSAPRMEYEPGAEETRSWFRQLTKPGLIEGSPWHPTYTSTREGDTLDLTIVEWSDSTRAHWGNRHFSVDDTAFRLYEDGELVSESIRAWGTHEVSGDPADLRLELDVARQGEDWWRYSTRTSTAWELESERPADGEAEALPLLLVDYDVPVDLRNRLRRPAGPGGTEEMELTVRHQPGVEDAPGISGARVWTSRDDGETWHPVRTVEPLGDGRFRALLDQGTRGTDAISLRVEAWDDDGNRIEQEIERAFGAAGR